MRFLRILLLLAATMLTGSCTGLGYYSQAVFGQLDILTRTRAIADLLDDTPADDMGEYTAGPSLTPAVKARLAAVLQVRDFATQALALPDNGSYRVYAKLDRSQAAWNVVATPEFSLTPIEWCFPVAGCVPYRGYFSRASALRFAEALQQDRLDVRVAGVAAYSTLGWFRDPVFSTQLRGSDTDIAALTFHELAHQQLYLRGDAAFNESFATAVEIEGMRRWRAATRRSTIICATRPPYRIRRLLRSFARVLRHYASPRWKKRCALPGATTRHCVPNMWHCAISGAESTVMMPGSRKVSTTRTWPRSVSITSTFRHSRRCWRACKVICLRSIGWHLI
jgi:predicted aminopeptidase